VKLVITVKYFSGVWVHLSPRKPKKLPVRNWCSFVVICVMVNR